MSERLIINPNDMGYVDHQFLVSLALIGSAWLVYADNAQDALDIAVDFAEEQNWPGYFLDPEQEAELEQFEQVEHAGNHGLALDSGEITIQQVDSDTPTYAYGTDNFRVTLYDPQKSPQHWGKTAWAYAVWDIPTNSARPIFASEKFTDRFFTHSTDPRGAAGELVSTLSAYWADRDEFDHLIGLQFDWLKAERNEVLEQEWEDNYGDCDN